MDEQLTKMHKDIYAIVASVQGGCQASKILHEYRENYGMLDFWKFGHKSLNEFLATVPKIFASKNAIGETLYKAKLADSEAARDIQYQVSMQKAPDRDKKRNFVRSYSTRDHRPQAFQRQHRHRSSYGAAFATTSSHDNQPGRILHDFKQDYVSTWVRTSTPIEDPNGQKPIPLLAEVSTYNRIHNRFVQNRDFAPRYYQRQPPAFEQKEDNRSVQHSHSTRSHSGSLSQHSQQDLGKRSRNNWNPYRQKANQAAATVPQAEAQRMSKTTQLLQGKEIKAERTNSSTTSGRSSVKGVPLFNWGKKSKEEMPEKPKRNLLDIVQCFSQMSLNERSSNQGVTKSQMRNESTEIKYQPMSTPNVDGLTSRIDGTTTPLVDYPFSDDSSSEEKIVSSSSSVKNIDKKKSTKNTQITTTTSVMNNVKFDEQVMSDLQRSTKNELKSLPKPTAQHEQVMSDWQGNTKNEPEAVPNLAVQQPRDRQVEKHEHRKAKMAAIIRRAVTDFGATQQNHTPAIDSGVPSRHEESPRSSR